MEFLKLLYRRSKLFYVALMCLSIVNGLLYTGLLMFINNTIAQKPMIYYPEYDWAVFVGLVLFSLISTWVFQTYMIKLSTQINFDFELKILEKLKKSSFQDFEKLGKEKVFTALEDIRILGNLPEVFMNALNALIIVACCFIYLFWISYVGALAILCIMSTLLVVYLLRNRKIEHELNQLRNLQNHYFRYLNDLIHGFKELKMSLVRTNAIHDDFLKENRVTSKRYRLKTLIGYMGNELTGNYSWYIVIGVIIFALPKVLDLNFEDVSSFLITILYLIGPVAVLITLIPTYTNVKIALQRLSSFSKIIDSALPDHFDPKEVKSEIIPFESIRFEEVVYEYLGEEGACEFRLGPVNLEIKKGEVVFVIGGNGSGKSTFVNLLTGLYLPKEGQILLNDEAVNSNNYPFYSNQLSAIFTNSYLFSENYDGFQLNPQNKELSNYIELMRMSDKIQLDEASNIISPLLSKGQQKRLSMIYTLLENKPFVVLDEWAAEQDPLFRAYFYEEFLPYLKEIGKTVFVITHDDEYYHHGDRIVKFDYGNIVSDEKMYPIPQEVSDIEKV